MNDEIDQVIEEFADVLMKKGVDKIINRVCGEAGFNGQHSFDDQVVSLLKATFKAGLIAGLQAARMLAEQNKKEEASVKKETIQ